MWVNSSQLLQNKWKIEDEKKRMKEQKERDEKEQMVRNEEKLAILEKEVIDNKLYSKFLIHLLHKIKTEKDVIEYICKRCDILIPELMKIVLEYCIVFDKDTEVGYSILTINYGIRDYYENLTENSLYIKAKVVYLKDSFPICIQIPEYGNNVDVGKIGYNYYFDKRNVVPKLGTWKKQKLFISENYRTKFKK